MRQRGLLVAGWVLAAVVTSLVASGAVAVAGGQVLDRPLRPLTAAEVAALPVVVTADSYGPCQPLASGGYACPWDEEAAGARTGNPVPTDGIDPAGEREGLGDGAPPGVPPASKFENLPDGLPLPVSEESEDPVGIDDDEVPPSDATVVRMEGGTVSVAGSGDELFFLWAISRPGYLTDVLPREETNQLVVVFSSTTRQSVLEASWVDDELVLDVFETRP